MRTLAIVAIAASLVSSVVAEQRRVLAELFTATWCPYCPYAEAAIDSLAHELGPESLVVLKYHVSDGLAIDEGEERGDWYVPGPFYIPNMWFDGTINEVGGDSETYSIYENYVENRLSVPSPLTIEPTFSIGITAGYASAKIKVVEPFLEGELKAYFVLYENDVNGEYHYVVRNILAVEDLTIASVGDSVEIGRSFEVDTEWDPDQMGIGIFVQSHSSREVLQASRVEPWMISPRLSTDSVFTSDSLGNNDGRVDPGETAEMTVTLFNEEGWQDAESISVTLRTDDECIVLLDSVARIPRIAGRSTGSNDDDPFRFEVLPCSSHWSHFELMIHAQSHDYSTADSFKILIGRPRLIVVDDDGAGYERYYFSALDSLGVLYDCSNWLRSDPSREIRHYETVIWLTGDDSVSTLTLEDIDSLGSFLDNGGNLFLTGQGIGDDIGSEPFYSEYLHSQWVGTASREYFVSGVPGDEIGDGMRFVILGAGGASNQTSQDILLPLNGADSIFVYTGGGVAGIKYGGTYKIVYLGFGFEAINDLVLGHTHRPECLKEILRWFGYPITEVALEFESPGQACPAMKISPNPFRSTTTISYLVAESARVSLRVYDSSGRYVQTLVNGRDEPGISTVEWNGTNFQGMRVPSGTYFVLLENPSGTFVKKILYIR